MKQCSGYIKAATRGPVASISATMSAVFLVVFCIASPVSATTVTLFGDDINFTFDDSTLFGTGTVIGNALFFSPTDFKNESLDGSNPGLVTDTLNVEINVNTGAANPIMDSVTVIESGDYILNGANSSVSASLRTQVTSLTTTDGLFPMQHVDLVQTGTITSPNDGSTNNWSLQSINDWQWSNETSINFQIQNNLTANTSLLGESAFIQKKSGAIGIEVTTVPLPASIWFLSSAMLAFFGAFRRSSRSA